MSHYRWKASQEKKLVYVKHILTKHSFKNVYSVSRTVIPGRVVVTVKPIHTVESTSVGFLSLPLDPLKP